MSTPPITRRITGIVSAPHAVVMRRARLAGAATLAVPLLAGAALVVGRVGLPAELVTGTVVAAAACGRYGLRLGRRALGSHRGVGLLSLGLLTCGGTCATAAVMGLAKLTPASASVVVTGGLAAATVMFVPALLLLPGAATDLLGRLRGGLDGVSVGICLLFTV